MTQTTKLREQIQLSGSEIVILKFYSPFMKLISVMKQLKYIDIFIIVWILLWHQLPCTILILHLIHVPLV